MAEREIRVLALASKAAGLAPGQRYRFEQWAPHLERHHGISIDLLPFESPRLSEVLYEPGHLVTKAALVSRDFVRRASVMKASRSYDAILIYREASLIGPAIYERLLARTGKPIILDFDDAIWSPAQAHLNGLFSRLHFYGKTSTICRMASAVTVGNDYLADYARQRNDRVIVVPSTIELADYPEMAEPAQDNPFVVGWTGSASTLPHFETARPALERLSQQISLKVRVICNQPPNRPIAGAETEFVAWTPEDEARQVGDCHAGLINPRRRRRRKLTRHFAQDQDLEGDRVDRQSVDYRCRLHVEKRRDQGERQERQRSPEGLLASRSEMPAAPNQQDQRRDCVHCDAEGDTAGVDAVLAVTPKVNVEGAEQNIISRDRGDDQ